MSHAFPFSNTDIMRIYDNVHLYPGLLEDGPVAAIAADEAYPEQPRVGRVGDRVHGHDRDPGAAQAVEHPPADAAEAAQKDRAFHGDPPDGNQAGFTTYDPGCLARRPRI